MKFSKSCSVLAASLLAGSATAAWAQHAGHGDMNGMPMADKTLLVAQLDGAQVSPGSLSKATGTGAFQLDPSRRTLEYRLTYQGLEGGAPQAIALYNFGRGKNGEVIAILCGGPRNPCPMDASGTISGSFKRNEGPKLDNNMIGEFNSERIYVEILAGDGNPEIRGQLEPNNSQVMVQNYIAELAPGEGASEQASGTAVVSETYLPDGTVQVSYLATVAKLTDAPTGVALTDNPRRKVKRDLLPQVKQRLSRNRQGGSLNGRFDAKDNATGDLLASRRAKRSRDAGIVIATPQNPDGEVQGVLKPVE